MDANQITRAAQLARAFASVIPTDEALDLGARLSWLPVHWPTLLEAVLEHFEDDADMMRPAVAGLELLDRAEAALVAGLRAILEGDSGLETFARLRRVEVPAEVLRRHFAPKAAA